MITRTTKPKGWEEKQKSSEALKVSVAKGWEEKRHVLTIVSATNTENCCQHRGLLRKSEWYLNAGSAFFFRCWLVPLPAKP